MNDMPAAHEMFQPSVAPPDPAMPVPNPRDYGGQPEAPEDEPFRRVVDGAHAAVDRLADAAALAVGVLVARALR